jgi:uncharacterized protein
MAKENSYPFSKNGIVLFVVLSCSISWLIWLPNVLDKHFNVGWGHSDWLHILGGLGPLVGAIVITFIFDKWTGVKKFFREKYRWPSLKWFLVGFGMPIAFFVVAYLWLGIFNHNWIRLSEVGLNAKVPIASTIGVWLIWLIFYGIGEESGWRGFLLFELTKKYDALISAIFVALIWATWHLPIFLYDKDFMAYGLGGTIGWVVGLMFGSVLLGWLVKRSQWILWPVIFWHGTFNLFTAGDRIGSTVPAFVSTLVLVIVVWIVWRYGKNLDTSKKIKPDC